MARRWNAFPMFNSLNMQIAALNAGIDATIEWQWDGGQTLKYCSKESK